MSNDKQGKASSSSENDMLDNLQVSSQKVLEMAQKKGRSKCPKCNSSRMFYCYTCYVPVESVPTGDIPSVKLPLKIDIIKHPNETDGKSTAVHAKLLAHEDVTVYTYPCIPDYDNHRHDIILVFPGPQAVPLKDSLLHLSHCNTHNKDSTSEPTMKRQKLEADSNDSENKDLKTEGKSPKIDCLKKVVFIDSTWNQTNKIMSDERLQVRTCKLVDSCEKDEKSYLHVKMARHSANTSGTPLPMNMNGFRAGIPTAGMSYPTPPKVIEKLALHIGFPLISHLNPGSDKTLIQCGFTAIGLVSVELTERKTCFWRHQKGSPDTYLSTIEAIYYFMVDYHMQILEKDYNGEYDNLLFFYSFMYRLVKNAKHAAGKL